jgi:hypothetical protein
VAVRLVAGRSGEGGRPDLEQDHWDAIRVLDPHFGQAPRLGRRSPRDGLQPRPAGRARRGHPAPGSRSSPSARESRPCARTLRVEEEHHPRIDLRAELLVGAQAQHVTVRSGGCGPRRWAAAGAGCPERPPDYFSSTLSDTAHRGECAPSRRSARLHWCWRAWRRCRRSGHSVAAKDASGVGVL